MAYLFLRPSPLQTLWLESHPDLPVVPELPWSLYCKITELWIAQVIPWTFQWCLPGWVKCNWQQQHGDQQSPNEPVKYFGTETWGPCERRHLQWRCFGHLIVTRLEGLRCTKDWIQEVWLPNVNTIIIWESISSLHGGNEKSLKCLLWVGLFALIKRRQSGLLSLAKGMGRVRKLHFSLMSNKAHARGRVCVRWV